MTRREDLEGSKTKVPPTVIIEEDGLVISTLKEVDQTKLRRRRRISELLR